MGYSAYTDKDLGFADYPASHMELAQLSPTSLDS
jgi:hypothetical protein